MPPGSNIVAVGFGDDPLLNYRKNPRVRKAKLFQVLHEIGHANFFAALDAKQESHRNVPQYMQERGAWCYALQQYRRFHRDGLDVADYLSQKEILEMVRLFLVKYEVVDGVDKILSGVHANSRLIEEGMLPAWSQIQELQAYLASSS